MTKFGLLVGGGGSVGVAWENGVLAGLVDATGFEPAKSTVIVGTSAGSSVGADMALHRAAMSVTAAPLLSRYLARLRADRPSGRRNG